MLDVVELTGWKARLVADGVAEMVRPVFGGWARRSSRELHGAVLELLWNAAGLRQAAPDRRRQVMSAPEIAFDSADQRDYFVGRVWQPVALALRASATPDKGKTMRELMQQVANCAADLASVFGAPVGRERAPRTEEAVGAFLRTVRRIVGDAGEDERERTAAEVRTAAEECGRSFAEALDPMARECGWPLQRVRDD